MSASRAQLLADHPDRRAILDRMSDPEKAAMFADWRFWARPEQLAPEWDWRWWFVQAGRGEGKTRRSSEWVLDRCDAFAAHNHPHLLALMNATYDEVRAIQLRGESGIEACAKMRGHVVDVPRTALEGRIRVWTPTGWHDTPVEIHTADKPDRVRGRNLHTIACDELAKWKQFEDAQGGTAFTNADLSLRALCPPGLAPQGLISTTPKPIKVIRELAAGDYGPTAQTRGSMFDNRANLDPGFIAAIERRYAGSRLGAQEIYGLLLEDVEGSLWKQAWIEATRVKIPAGATPDTILDLLPPLTRVVVGVDPSGSKTTGTCGIVVAGVAWMDGLPHLYILEDASGGMASDEWARKAIEMYYRWHADVVVGEVNYGGDMVVTVLNLTDPTVPTDVVRATRGKAVRAEPVASLWSPDPTGARPARGHVVGWWPELESEWTTWTPRDADSPDRLDASVWCGHELIGDLTAVDTTRAHNVADLRL